MINKTQIFNPIMTIIYKLAVFINSLLINKKINNFIINKKIQVKKFLMKTNNNHFRNFKFNRPKVKINRISKIY